MKIRYLIEAAMLQILFSAFKAMPLDMASAIGGAMARVIGPLMGAHSVARKNLEMVFPELSDEERRKILTGMWDNLGRVAGEFPHLASKTLAGRVQLTGAEYMPTTARPALLFSGHIGNWEMTYPVLFRHGVPVGLVYRHINNPFVEKIIGDLRASQSSALLAKGPRGAIRLLRVLKNRYSLAMLIDQKMNDGIPVPFFGRDAMTAPAIAQLALRYNMPILPAYVVRTKGAHFEGRIFPPLEYRKTGDDEKDVLAIMTAINQTLEGWIRQHPEQWFWVHRRWPK